MGSSMRDSELRRKLEGSIGGLKSCSTNSPWVTSQSAAESLDDLDNGIRHTKRGMGVAKPGPMGKRM